MTFIFFPMNFGPWETAIFRLTLTNYFNYIIGYTIFVNTAIIYFFIHIFQAHFFMRANTVGRQPQANKEKENCGAEPFAAMSGSAAFRWFTPWLVGIN